MQYPYALFICLVVVASCAAPTQTLLSDEELGEVAQKASYALGIESSEITQFQQRFEGIANQSADDVAVLKSELSFQHSTSLDQPPFSCLPILVTTIGEATLCLNPDLQEVSVPNSCPFAPKPYQYGFSGTINWALTGLGRVIQTDVAYWIEQSPATHCMTTWASVGQYKQCLWTLCTNQQDLDEAYQQFVQGANTRLGKLSNSLTSTLYQIEDALMNADMPPQTAHYAAFLIFFVVALAAA
ncbi:MAG: hypothetical protein IPJ88_01590 [Myxococcales bacterium]|nr:MAG: hypothetical protein IPJ88_01590 [Myxococcales bacterium]